MLVFGSVIHLKKTLPPPIPSFLHPFPFLIPKTHLFCGVFHRTSVKRLESRRAFLEPRRRTERRQRLFGPRGFVVVFFPFFQKKLLGGKYILSLHPQKLTFLGLKLRWDMGIFQLILLLHVLSWKEKFTFQKVVQERNLDPLNFENYIPGIHERILNPKVLEVWDQMIFPDFNGF